MKLLFIASIFWFCCDVSDGFVYRSDLYSARYSRRNLTFDGLFTPTPVASTGIQALINAQSNVDNTRCRNIHQFATTPTLQQLVNFQHELVDLCPQLYETIRGKNITTWGPVDEFLQIWYMKFIDALWQKIQVKTCRCQLYDDLVNGAAAASDTALHTFLEANYDPALCVINEQTMYKWNLFLIKPEIKNRAIKFIRAGEFSLAIIHDISKSYLPDSRYRMYFEPGPPFLICSYFDATKTNPAFVAPYKVVIRGSTQRFNESFPTLDLADRQKYLLMQFCVQLDYSPEYYYLLFNRIPLDPTDEITHYHLVLYLCRKDFLIANRLQYESSPQAPALCTTTTTTPPCTKLPNAAALYIEDAVVLQSNPGNVFAGIIRTYNNCIDGVINYYNGATPSVHTDASWGDPVWVGVWQRGTCATSCICTLAACYTPVPGNPSIDPWIQLYPHCITSDNCFATLIFFTSGAIVNPMNPADMYSFAAQDSSSGDVTDPVFPRITRIGCSSCPLMT